MTDDFFPDIWDVLHDGSIESVARSTRSTLVVDVGIEYLLERFDPPAKFLRIELADCNHFAFKEYGESDWIEDLPSITDICLGILSSELRRSETDATVVIHCDDGVIELTASGGSLSLDGERAITLDDLKRVASEYWDDFGNERPDQKSG